MSFGLVELITLLLSLSGFSLQQNPKAPTPDQALQYAMPDADVVVHCDAAAVIGNNYKLLLALPNHPQIKSSPELSKTVRKAVGEVDGLKGLIKTMTGIDLTTDVSDATVFMHIPPAGKTGPPDMLVTVRGKFTSAQIDRIAKVVGGGGKAGAPPVRRADGMLELPPGELPFGAIAVTKDGTFLAGSTKLVAERVAATWKVPARAPGGNLAHVASVLEAKPVFAVILTMSPAAKKRVTDDFKGTKNFITDVLTRHKLAALSLFRDGVGWTWIDTTKAGLDSMTQISEGMFDMMRAAQIAPRGFAKIAMGALDSYRGDKRVDELIKRKADLWKIVESYTGDGTFKVSLDKNPATLRLTARATGKSLSDVIPAGMLLPGAIFLVIGRSAPEPPATSNAPPITPKLSPNPKPVAPRPAPAPPPRR